MFNHSLKLLQLLLLTDIKIGTKYPSRFLFSIFQLGLMISLFFFISETLGEVPLLKAEYFPFVATGLAFQHFFSGIVNASAEKIQEYRDYGMLEEMLFSHYPAWQILLAAGAHRSLFSVAKGFVILCASFYVFSPIFNWSLLFITLGLSFLLALQLSFIASCSFLMWKRFSLLEIGGTLVTLFLSGVYFPVSVLPQPLYLLSQCNPIMHAIQLFRSSLGFSLPGEIAEGSLFLSFAIMAVTAVLLFLFNLWFYQKTMWRLKSSGVTNHF